MAISDARRPIVRFAAYLLFALLAVPLAARAADDSSAQARQWLEKMEHAVKTMNYEGSFVYIHGDHLEAMRIVHVADKSGEHERLLSLNGAAREILRDNDMLTCILPDTRSVVVEKSRPRKYIPAGLLKLDKKLFRHYEFKMLGQDRMTGRAAQVIEVKARDQYRYGYRLWLDRATGMLLKSDLVDGHGMPVEQMMFTSIRMDKEIPPSALKPVISGKGYKWFRQEKPPWAPNREERAWKVTRLPPGFTMSMHVAHDMPVSVMPVDHMMFTDGLASVSVYVEEPDKKEKPFNGTSRMGAVNAFGKVIAGHQVTVVGEVPKATVMMIGESVRYEPDVGTGDHP